MQRGPFDKFRGPTLAVLLCVGLLVPGRALYAETFRFQYEDGEKHRILTTVSEDVYVNGRLNNRTEIINRITEEVTATGTASETGFSSPSDLIEVSGHSGAAIHGTFMTTEEATMPHDDAETKNFTWGLENESDFFRDDLGQYAVAGGVIMPTVRNIPVFPEKDVQPGDRWYADGCEVHDLSSSFPLSEPLIVPFTATYTYVGIADEAETKAVLQGDSGNEGVARSVDAAAVDATDETELHKITAEYTLYTEYPVPRNADGSYPVAIMGFSNRTIYFDNQRGKVITWNENFRIVLETKRGDRIEYRGTSKTEIDRSTLKDRQAVVQKVQEQIESLGIENTAVTATEQGVTISIENIQFLPDSAWLTPEEKAKLALIADILAPFTDSDLLVTGHTARVGSEDSCQQLSEKRARSVADYLKNLGLKDEYHVFTRGMGSRDPIADNSTEAGRERNRRVEITIVD